VNMAKHRNNPNMPFWKMIKEGYDHFEVTRQEPKVDFCEKKYVFDAVKPPDAKHDPVFEASAKCPAYVIPQEVADAVRQKQEDDEAETAKLIAKGTPVARMNTGIDGGMNKVFAAALPNGDTGLSEGGHGQGLSLIPARLPGTIPIAHVNPPHAPDDPAVAVAAAPAPGPGPRAQVASAAPAQSDGFFSSLARKVGLSGGEAADTTAATAPPVLSKPKVTEARRSEPLHPNNASDPKATKQAQAGPRPPLKPSLSDPASPPAAANAAVAGSQAIVPANSFDSRFSATQ
jgi:hypothetical protein